MEYVSSLVKNKNVLMEGTKVALTVRSHHLLLTFRYIKVTQT